MNEIQCVAVTLLLLKRVLERVKERGHLTADEKAQIFRTLRLLVHQFLSGGILHELCQGGELLGQFQMPRVQNSYLEYKCANADDERDPRNPLCEKRLPF